MTKLKRLGFSCAGNHRAENQDYFCFDEIHSIVSDGMGGRSCGFQAAKFICTELLNSVRKTKSITSTIKDDTRQKFEQVNEMLRGKIPNSGTTASLIGLFDKEYYIANIGDSRVYLFREKQLICLTVDHNVAQNNNIPVNSHILTNYFGKYRLDPPFFCDRRIEIRRYIFIDE